MKIPDRRFSAKRQKFAENLAKNDLKRTKAVGHLGETKGGESRTMRRGANVDIGECDHDDQQWETQSGWGELGAMLASEKTGAELT